MDKVPVSQLFEEYELQPSVFYDWQRQAFKSVGGALQRPALDREVAGEGARARERGSVKECWARHHTRYEVVDFVRRWSDRAEIRARTSSRGSACSGASPVTDRIATARRTNTTRSCRTAPGP